MLDKLAVAKLKEIAKIKKADVYIRLWTDESGGVYEAFASEPLISFDSPASFYIKAEAWIRDHKK